VIQAINLRMLGREVDFCMYLDHACPMEHAVLHYVEQGQPCEPESVSVMLRAIKPGDLVVDAGANIGFFTLLMSKLVGDDGQVLAFEPGDDNRSRLRKNLELNNCTNVRVIEQPLWSSAGTVEMFTYADGGSNSLWALKDGDRGTLLHTTTLEQECKTCPSFIKLDIEGAEVRALRGAWKLLKHRPVIVTEINRESLERAGTSIEELRGILTGFDCFGLSDTGHFPTYIPRHTKVVPCKPNTNVMFSMMTDVQKMWTEAHV